MYTVLTFPSTTTTLVKAGFLFRESGSVERTDPAPSAVPLEQSDTLAVLSLVIGVPGNSTQAARAAHRYSSPCVEGRFSEVGLPIYGVLRCSGARSCIAEVHELWAYMQHETFGHILTRVIGYRSCTSL